MVAKENLRNKTIYGDFQTPIELARDVIELATETGGSVSCVVEPTCGVGNFLLAACNKFGASVSYHGFEINQKYVQESRDNISSKHNTVRATVECQDFYKHDWKAFFQQLPNGILVVGNPPWVTNAALGSLGGGNLPEKSNFQRHRGFAAKTGKANFDIAEWMLIRLIQSLQGKPATIAMLCKTATARKVLQFSWKSELEIQGSSILSIDAKQHFGASVDACLFITHTGAISNDSEASLYHSLSFRKRVQTFGMANGEIVSDLDTFNDMKDLDGLQYRRWRSGIKHDAAKIMELERVPTGYRNGLGEVCELETKHIYPLLKSSDLANNRLIPRKQVLLTQKLVSDDTNLIETEAPLTWLYLLSHATILDRRGSSIYAKRSRFAIFGVGSYTFSPWKVAISGFYKNLHFCSIGSHDGKPIVLDDTCYFIPCETEEEAQFFTELLNSDTSRRFIRSLTFFDTKRAVTIEVLKRVDLKKLADRFGKAERASRYLVQDAFDHGSQQLLLFEKPTKYRTTE